MIDFFGRKATSNPNSLNNHQQYEQIIAESIDHIEKESGSETKYFVVAGADSFAYADQIGRDFNKHGELELVRYTTPLFPISAVGLHLNPEDEYFGRNALYRSKSFNVYILSFSIIFSQRDTISVFIANSLDEFDRYIKDFDKRRKSEEDGAIFTLISTGNGLRRNRVLDNKLVKREDVLMDEKIKDEIFRSIDQFFSDDGKFFSEHGIPYKRGILLHGAPGNGKTTLINSIVSTVKANIIYWQVSENTNSDTVNDIFNSGLDTDKATILIIEDMDSIPQSARSTFLNKLDGASPMNGVFIIGTTNYPEKVDPALFNRAGRFDRTYEIEKPDETQRLAYLKLKGTDQFVSELELQKLAKLTNDFSMATLNEVYISIALNHKYEGSADIDQIVKDIKATLVKYEKGAFGKSKSNVIGFRQEESV